MSEFFDELITGLNEAIAIEHDKLKGLKQKYRGCIRHHHYRNFSMTSHLRLIKRDSCIFSNFKFRKKS